jgi:hypothetical protein
MVDAGACAWMQVIPGPSPYDENVDLPTGDLLASLRARDPHTLERLVSEHARRLYRGARSMGFSTGEAEDLTQEVFVTFLETLDRFEGRAQVGTWLFGILYRKAHERRRSRQRDERTESIEQVFEARFDTGGGGRNPRSGPTDSWSLDRPPKRCATAPAHSRICTGMSFISDRWKSVPPPMSA